MKTLLLQLLVISCLALTGLRGTGDGTEKLASFKKASQSFRRGG